jgi:protein tyrosine/serine phosphatase
LSDLNCQLDQQQYDLIGRENITITKFQPVTNWLYRGGQPDATGIDQLAKMGFRSVISLRWNLESIKSERALCQQSGLNFFSIPLSYWILPTRKEIDRFFSIIDDKSKQPIFLHCLHGRDRTGMLVAIYRIARENWTADAAYTEMKNKGFRHIQMHQLKWAVYGYERRLKRMSKSVNLTNKESSIQLATTQSEP